MSVDLFVSPLSPFSEACLLVNFSISDGHGQGASAARVSKLVRWEGPELMYDLANTVRPPDSDWTCVSHGCRSGSCLGEYVDYGSLEGRRGRFIKISVPWYALRLIVTTLTCRVSIGRHV